jgi:ribosomal protein S27AE
MAFFRGSMEKSRKDRRRVNQAVGAEKRRGRVDRRRCPKCGSTMSQSVEKAPGGTMTRLYCTKCEFETDSRQVDEASFKALAGFEFVVQGTPRQPMIALDPDFLKIARLKPGDMVELKAVYVPGTETVLTWVFSKMR